MADDGRGDSFERAVRLRVWSRLAGLVASLLVFAFVYLFCNDPMAWAIPIAAGFVLGTGLFATSFLLGMRLGMRAVRLALPIGSAFLGLLWLLYRSQR